MQAIAELQQREPETKLATVEAISTAEYPTPAKRPMNSRLDCGKLERTFGWRMMEWRESLKAVLRELPRLLPPGRGYPHSPMIWLGSAFAWFELAGAGVGQI